MLWKTHLAFGILVGLVLMPFFNKTHVAIYFALVLIGALFPDIDDINSKMSQNIPVIPKILQFVTRHRGVIHSLWFGLLICGLVYLFIGTPYGIALFIGYMSHLVIDGLTMQGINFLHPVSKLHLSGFIQTGKTGELVIFFLCILGIIIEILRLIPF